MEPQPDNATPTLGSHNRRFLCSHFIDPTLPSAPSKTGHSISLDVYCFWRVHHRLRRHAFRGSVDPLDSGILAFRHRKIGDGTGIRDDRFCAAASYSKKPLDDTVG